MLRALVVVLLAGLTIAGCGPSGTAGDAGHCPMTLPGCTTPPPSYASDVAPLVMRRCVVCHFTGSSLAPFDLSTQAALAGRQGTAIGMLYTCNMPPAGAEPLTDAERTMLLAWLQCGAPDN